MCLRRNESEASWVPVRPRRRLSHEFSHQRWRLGRSSEYRTPDERPCRIRRDTGGIESDTRIEVRRPLLAPDLDRKHRPRQASRTSAIFHLLSSSRTDYDSPLIAPLGATPHGQADDHAPSNHPAVPIPKPRPASRMPGATRPTPYPRRPAHPGVHIGMTRPAESLDIVRGPMALDRARPARRRAGAV